MHLQIMSKAEEAQVTGSKAHIKSVEKLGTESPPSTFIRRLILILSL